MNGFKVCYNGQEKFITMQSGVLVICMLCNNGKARLNIGGVDRDADKQLLWDDKFIELGDKVEIEYTDVEICSEPAHVVNLNTNKLEEFRKLEKFLKEKGVL